MILPALVTPMDEGGRFIPASYEKLLDRVYSAGCDGVYICGQTGEGHAQSVPQRKAIAEEAMRLSPAGKLVMIHTGAYTTAEAIELTKHASSLGAGAISSLPPVGVAYTFAEIKRYYQAVLAVSSVPAYIYFFPSLAPAIQSVDQLFELASIPGVVGLKFTAFDLYALSLLVRSGLTVFNGHDEVLAAGLLMGAHGGIGTFYNLTPELFVAIEKHARAGEWAEARKVQDRVNDLIRLTLRFPVLAAVKQMLAWRGIPCGAPVGPRGGLEDTAVLAAALRSAGFDRLSPQ